MTGRYLPGAMILTLVVLLLGSAVFSPVVTAHWTGRFDLGGSPTFYADNQLENRTPITSRIRFRFSPDTADQWLVVGNVRLRSELNSEDSHKWQIRDLYLQYGQDIEDGPVSLSLGLFQPRNVSGIGDLMGLGARYQFVLPVDSLLSLGVFGGANAVINDGGTDTDGVRVGGFIEARGNSWGQASIGYVSLSEMDFSGDEREYVAFSTTLRIGDRFDFYHSGEFTVSSEAGDDNTLSYYYANAGYDLRESVRFSVTYDLYDRMPYLQSLDENEEDSGDTFDRYEVYRGQSIGPRLDWRISSNWRVFGRYRYRETDDSHGETWHQYLLGFGCADLMSSGIGVNGSVFISRGDTREYETAFISVTRDIVPALSVSVNVAADRFARLETVTEVQHIDSTYRAGIGGFYRINRSMTAILEYERTFGDSDQDREDRIFFNWQYRF